MNMKRLLFVMSASFALVLATSVPASAAGGMPRDALGIIKAKTGKAAVQVTDAQSVNGLSVGVGRDKRGKALPSFAQTTATSVSMMAVLGNGSQTTANFTLAIPSGAEVKFQPDGSLAVIREVSGPQTGGVEVFWTFAAPWAVDANGKSLPTAYTSYAKGVLTQSVDMTGASFPVVADPSYKFGYYYVPVVYETFTRAETSNLWNNRWWMSKEVSLICFVSGIWAMACVIATQLYWYQIESALDYAVHHSHRCFKIRIPYPATYWPVAGAAYSVYC